MAFLLTTWDSRFYPCKYRSSGVSVFFRVKGTITYDEINTSLMQAVKQRAEMILWIKRSTVRVAHTANSKKM